MALVLTDLASQKPVKPLTRPTPGFARTDDGGKLLVAALAPAPSGWLVVPVAADAGCAVNGLPVTTPTPVAAGDRLTLAFKEFEVAESGVEPTVDDGGLAPARCEVTVRHQGREIARAAAVAGPLVIGTGADCGLVLPADTGVARHHALLLHAADRWHLFILSDRGASRFGDTAVRFHLPLVKDQSVWLADAELTVLYDDVDPLDLAYGAPVVTPVVGGGETVGLGLETEDDAGPVSHPSSTSSANATPAPFFRAMAVSAKRDNALHLRALGVCQWLQAEHTRLAPHPHPARVAGRAFAERVEVVQGVVEDLDRFAADLRDDPWDPDTLFELADYLRRLGLPDNARWVLKELYRQHSADPVVAESLSVLAWSQAKSAGKPAAQKLDDLKRAHKYITLAVKLRPNDYHLLDLQRAIGSELTLTEMARSGPTTRRPADRG